MKMEMEQGGALFFDLFVAMCNHIVSLQKPYKITPTASVIQMLMILSLQDDLKTIRSPFSSPFTR